MKEEAEETKQIEWYHLMWLPREQLLSGNEFRAIDRMNINNTGLF